MGDVLWLRRVRARKSHACDYCGSKIVPGCNHLVWCWVEGGRASTVRAHVACDVVAKHYYDAVDCYWDERWVEVTPLDETLREADSLEKIEALCAALLKDCDEDERERFTSWAVARWRADLDEGAA